MFAIIGDDEYGEEHHHHHHQSGAPGSQSPDDVRQHQVYPGYNYPPPPNVVGASAPPAMHDARAPMSHSSAIAARKESVVSNLSRQIYSYMSYHICHI
jgi:hypothetical protein